MKIPWNIWHIRRHCEQFTEGVVLFWNMWWRNLSLTRSICFQANLHVMLQWIWENLRNLLLVTYWFLICTLLSKYSKFSYCSVIEGLKLIVLVLSVFLRKGLLQPDSLTTQRNKILVMWLHFCSYIAGYFVVCDDQATR